ncbi:MAG: hypothetical protein GXP27_05705 [Planctomycetes bacterium]|nr:hypothetical protein [Planctomycetota bacterium]
MLPFDWLQTLRNRGRVGRVFPAYGRPRRRPRRRRFRSTAPVGAEVLEERTLLTSPSVDAPPDSGEDLAAWSGDSFQPVFVQDWYEAFWVIVPQEVSAVEELGAVEIPLAITPANGAWGTSESNGGGLGAWYWTASGDALAGEDYQSVSGEVAPGTLSAGDATESALQGEMTIDGGWAGTLTIPLIDDSVPEGPEVFTVTFQVPLVWYERVLTTPEQVADWVQYDSPPPWAGFYSVQITIYDNDTPADSDDPGPNGPGSGGGSGDDTLGDGSGNDTLSDGSGGDTLGDGSGSDTLGDGSSGDSLGGGGGQDTVDGGSGNDTLGDGSGGDPLTDGLDDTLPGDGGDDTTTNVPPIVGSTDPMGPVNSFQVPEDTPVGDSVGWIYVTDPDSPQVVLWIEDVTDAWGNAVPWNPFDIDPVTGELFLIDELDYETVSHYYLTVGVSDFIDWNTGLVDVQVGDVNEPPEVSDAVFAVAANAPVGTVVGTMTSTDEDLDRSPWGQRTHWWSLVDADVPFAIDAGTGEITVADALDEAAFPYSFGVRVTDAGNLSAEATVTVELNYPPIAADDQYIVRSGETLTIFPPGFLENDYDPDGDSFDVESLDSSGLVGSLTYDSNGGFTYSSPEWFTGREAFTYRITDGRATSEPATVTIHVGDIASTDSIGFAWEGDGLMDLYLHGLTAEGTIVRYELDLNNDGTYDQTIEDHDEAIHGVLVEDVPVSLLGVDPLDDGRYSVGLRITNSQDISREFTFDVVIGNVPPDIQISGPEDVVQPGEPCAITVQVVDPGPDTVSSVHINWGDGRQQTSASAPGTFYAIYAEPGEYTITVTVTDEDTTNTLSYGIRIGPPPSAPQDQSPRITGVSARYVGGGDDVELTIQAEDYAGNPVFSIEWDVDGDGVFETSGASVVLTPGPDHYPYVATVRITDAVGRVTEALFAFADPVDARPRATASNYRKLFIQATPELEGRSDWEIHHTKQRMIAERYLRERGINVHETEYLRAVPDFVHDEITAAQNKWWTQKAKELIRRDPVRYGSLEEAMQVIKETIPLEEVEAFERQIETQYSKYWIKAGEGRKIKIVQRRLKKLGRFSLSKPSRFQNLGLTFTGFAILTLVTEKGKAAMNIANHPPQAQVAWRRLEGELNSYLDRGLERGYATKEDAMRVVDALVSYMRALGLDEEASAAWTLLFRQVQLSAELVPP